MQSSCSLQPLLPSSGPIRLGPPADVVALSVIALAYTEIVSVVALLVAIILFGVVLAMRRTRVSNGVPYSSSVPASGWRRLRPAFTLRSPASPSESSPPPTRPVGMTSNRPVQSGFSSGKSRPPTTRARRAARWRSRSHQTSASSISSTRGRATLSFRYSRWPTQGSS